MSSVTEETKLPLPNNDPQAGYLPRDPSGVFATGTVPDVEQEAYDANVKEYEDAVKNVEEGEDKVVKERQVEAEKAQAESAETQEETVQTRGRRTTVRED